MQIEHNAQNKEGYHQALTPAKLPEGTGEEKLYHTRYPGSTFITRTGEVHHFNGAGNFVTSDLAVQAELDRITDKAGSSIYTRAPVITQADIDPVNEIRNSAAEVIRRLELSKQQSNIPGQ